MNRVDWKSRRARGNSTHTHTHNIESIFFAELKSCIRAFYLKGWLLVVLQEPKHVQPQLFWQAWQGGRLFGLESGQHGGPDGGGT